MNQAGISNGFQYLTSSTSHQLIVKAILVDPFYLGENLEFLTKLESYFSLLCFFINLNQEEKSRKVVSMFLERVKVVWEQEPNELVEYGANFWLNFVRNMINGALWNDSLFLLEIALSNIFFNLIISL